MFMLLSVHSVHIFLHFVHLALWAPRGEPHLRGLRR